MPKVVTKAAVQENFVLLFRERKPNSSSVPVYIHWETIVIHLVKVTITDFKDSLMSKETCTIHKTFLLLAQNLFTLSIFITSFAHLENSHL